MTSTQLTTRPTPTDTTTVGSAVGQPQTRRPIRRRDRLAARIRAASLDAELAVGGAPDETWLRNVRAAVLTAPETREQLARDWTHLLRLRTVRWTAAPLNRQGLHESADAIAELIGQLRAPGAVHPRGVAMARLLLSDAAGPVYLVRAGRPAVLAIDAARQHLQLD